MIRLTMTAALLCSAVLAHAAAAGEGISREAKRRMNRGHAAFKAAKTPEELLEAAKEFQLAAEAAPRWPDPVFNQAQALEKAGEAAGAKRAYEKYLELSPKAADAAAVEKKIDELEFLAEKKEKDKDKVVLEGRWAYASSGVGRTVELSGNFLRVLREDGGPDLEATLSGRSFEGRAWAGEEPSKARGTISQDNRTIKWEFSVEGMPGVVRRAWDSDGDGWSDQTPLVRMD